jgi:hypothetical protein
MSKRVRRYLRRKGAPLTTTDQSAFIRWQLPYGCFHCADGREVLFDRDYAPIWSPKPSSWSGICLIR